MKAKPITRSERNFRKLLALVSPIITIFKDTYPKRDISFSVSTYHDEEIDSEVVTITFDEISFNWDFLEPLTNLMIKRNTTWEISTMEEKMQIHLTI